MFRYLDTFHKRTDTPVLRPLRWLTRGTIVLAMFCVSILPADAREQQTQKQPVADRPGNESGIVRVAAVNTTLSSGLLPHLIRGFEKQFGLTVEFLESERTSEGKKGRSTDLYEAARTGKADLIIAHYGKPYVRPFVTEGFGEFPQLVFANQAVLIGPADDPAGVAEMEDATQAMKKIADTGAIFLVNNLAGQAYLSEMLWNGAGRPDKGDWFIRSTEHKARAVKDAEQRGAYVLFGVQPFRHFREKHNSTMKMLVWKDPMFQRPMASIVVRADRVPGVNQNGAWQLQQYLLSAPVQADVKAFRSPGTDEQYWWPVARGNNPADLSLR